MGDGAGIHITDNGYGYYSPAVMTNTILSTHTV